MRRFYRSATPPTEISTLSLHDALPIFGKGQGRILASAFEIGELKVRQIMVPRTRVDFLTLDQPLGDMLRTVQKRSEEHTSELQSHVNLVCRLLLEKKKTTLIPASPRAI